MSVANWVFIEKTFLALRLIGLIAIPVYSYSDSGLFHKV